MSDRFYSQLAEHCSISEGELKMAFWDKTSPMYKFIERKVMPKVTRKELTAEISELLGRELNLTKLNLKTLEIIAEQVRSKKTKRVTMPEGRLKAPYFVAIHEALRLDKRLVIELDTATVAVLTSLLEALNGYK